MKLVYLESLEDPRLDAYARLTEAQLRNKLEPQKGIFIAESFKVIERALEKNLQPLSFLMDEHWIETMQPLVERAETMLDAEVSVFVLPPDELKQLTGFELTRGALAAFRRPELPAPEALLATAERIAVFENITNFTNIGALFRSAAALNVDAVLVTPSCCDPLYRRCVRVSMGTVFQIPWTRIGSQPQDWPSPGLALLKKYGFTTIALALSDDALHLDDPLLKQHDKLAIVLGTEGDGLSAHTIAQCDCTVSIPMHHGVDSLNVASASAVAFWELQKS